MAVLNMIFANALITPEPGAVIWSTITFLILLVLLRSFAWKPILNAIKDREMSIEGALKSAEKAREDMEKLQADNEIIITQAKYERDNLLKEAKEVKEQLISDAREKASEESAKLIEAAKVTIENEKAAALNEIKEQMAELSVQIAEKILKQKLDGDKQQKELIDSMLKDIKLN